MLVKKLDKNQKNYLRGFLGTFLSLCFIGLFHEKIFHFTETSHLFLTGAFGATSVLIYSETQSPLAQPRNLFLGHLLSAFVGVTIYKLFGENLWFSAALSVALSIVLMRAAKAQHPPGGATALIANIGGTQIHDLGYAYLWQPVFCSLVILFIFALVINNLIDFGSYPTNFEVQWQKVKSYLSK